MSNSLEIMFNFGTRRTFRDLRLEFSVTTSYILLNSLKKEEMCNPVWKDEFENVLISPNTCYVSHVEMLCNENFEIGRTHTAPVV